MQTPPQPSPAHPAPPTTALIGAEHIVNGSAVLLGRTEAVLAPLRATAGPYCVVRLGPYVAGDLAILANRKVLLVTELGKPELVLIEDLVRAGAMLRTMTDPGRHFANYPEFYEYAKAHSMVEDDSYTSYAAPGSTAVVPAPKATDLNSVQSRAESPDLNSVRVGNGIDLGPDPPPETIEERPQNLREIWAQLGLDCTKAGPLPNASNAAQILEAHLMYRGHIWYDTFCRRVYTDYDGGEHEWADSDTTKVMIFCQRQLGIGKMSAAAIHDAVTYVAMQHERNSCREWLESLKWDGTPRLDALMADGFGAQASDYATAVGRCWFISMVARVMRPGCKVDTVPVFEGMQGAGKSTALSIVGGDWYAECHESVLSKDFYMLLDGKMLVEVAEMHAFSRSEVERIKGVISCRVDRYRAPYDRSTMDRPRQTVLAGTTNRNDWNTDDTGARRFWPIECGKINRKLLKSTREQLFAEAVQAFKNGEKWWHVPQDQALEEQENRRRVDSWEELIEGFLIGKTTVTVTEIMADCLKLEQRDMSPVAQSRVNKALAILGWTKRNDRKLGERKRYFERNTVPAFQNSGLTH